MKHYVRTILQVPGAGTAIHVAELEDLNDTQCTLVRIIELAPDDTIMGARGRGKNAGTVTVPNDVVPHPKTYNDFPDVESVYHTEAEFEALWSEATAKFPGLR